MKIMKKLFIGIFLATLVLPVTFGQRNNVIKVNLFSPIVKTGSFFYEHVLNDDKSTQVGFFFTFYNLGDFSLSGFGVTPEFRYYLSQSRAPKGIFIAPFLRYQQFKVTNNTTSGVGSLASYGGGLLIGAQTLLKETITIEAFLGPVYYAANAKVESGTSSPDEFVLSPFDGFTVRAGITVGFAF